MGLLEKIKNKYPAGTQFYDLVGNRLFTSKGSFYDEQFSKNDVYILVQSNEYGNKSARVFKDGKYAKIKQKTYELWTY